MILPGSKELLSSSWTANLSVLMLEEGELLVWSAWSLSDSWAAWTEQLTTETERTTTTRQRIHLSRQFSYPDTLYPDLVLVSCLVSVLLVLVISVSVSCWLAHRAWRREKMPPDLREQFQFQWDGVELKRDAGLVRYIKFDNIAKPLSLFHF